MSTQINVTVGDQRLLQANKARTAANQQNLDDRLLAKQTEEKAAPLVEAQRAAEETPGSIPVRRIPRRPAAQRDAATLKYGITLIKDLRVVSADPQTVIGAPWLRYIRAQSGVGIDTYYYAAQISVPESVRNVSYNTQRIQPFVYVSDSQSFNSTTPPVFNNTKQLDGINNTVCLTGYWWLLKVRRYIYEGYTAASGKGGQYKWYESSGPAWPITLNPYGPHYLEKAVISSTSTFTFISYVVSYYICDMYTVTGYFAPAPSGLGDGPGEDQRLVVGTNSRLIAQAFYAKINNSTQEAEYRNTTLLDTSPTFLYPRPDVPLSPFFVNINYTNFVEAMFNDDPRKQLYQATSRIDWALDPYISNSTYDPESGLCVVAAKDKNAEKIFVFSRTLDKNLPYAQVLIDIARPVAQFISTNTATAVANNTPQNFKLVTQFQNVYGSTVYTSPYAGEQI